MKEEEIEDCNPSFSLKENAQPAKEEASQPKRKRMTVQQIKDIMKNVPQSKKPVPTSTGKPAGTSSKKVGICEPDRNTEHT